MQSNYPPTVSIITRTKHRPLFLNRAIQSVLNQSFQDWEQIIVNDGGDDLHLQGVVDSYREMGCGRTRVINNQRSPGRWGAANAGLLAARGRYFVLLDDDDTWHPTFLSVTVEKLAELHDRGIRAVATQSDAIFEEVSDGVIRELFREPYNPDLRMITLFRIAGGAGKLVQPNAILFSTSLRDEVGLFDENLPVIGDWEFCLRVLLRFNMFVIPQVHACYHHRPGVSGVYGNSVFAGAQDHQLAYTDILNRSLRTDLKKGQFDLGFLMNISKSIAENELVLLDSAKRLRHVEVRAGEWHYTRNRLVQLIRSVCQSSMKRFCRKT